MVKAGTIAAVNVVFTVFSFWLIAQDPDGVLGVFTVAGREPWALQMLVDISIAMTLFITWMIPDARRRGIPALPYAIACVLLGSIGALSYLVHREIRGARSAPAVA